jgi:aspartate/methionine/tyrosine aminotransferase
MTNSFVASTPISPITEAYGWLDAFKAPEGHPLIDVAQAVPGYPPPQELFDHLRNVDFVEMSRYGPVLGQPELRAEFGACISAAYGSKVRDDQVAITSGANQAFCLALLALCEPGDQVIMPVPYYFNHDMWLRMNGIEAIHLRCGEEMLPDPSAAAELITERTKAICLVTPNNPTGRVYPPDLIAAFARLASSNGIHLVIDETYRDFRSSTEAPHDLFSDPCWDEALVHIYSFSKVFSITGLRVGAIAAETELLVEIDKIADCVAICPSRIGQEAVRFGLAHLDDWVEENRRTMNRRVDQFRDLMTESDSPFEVVSAGAYFAYVRHPFEGTSSIDVAKRLLADRAVLCLAGEMFGNDQHGFLRLAFANLDEERIPELVLRLNQSLTNHGAE